MAKKKLEVNLREEAWMNGYQYAMSEVEKTIYAELTNAYEAKMRELPPPPDGYYYRPELKRTEVQGENHVITVELTLEKKPV